MDIGGYNMASAPKFEYTPQNYIVNFGWSNEISYLLLCYNVSHKYCFVDLRNGRVLNLVFDRVDEAEKWLYKNASVHEKNAIEVTYVP